MEMYLINYLREHAKTPEARKYIEMLKVELDWYIYNYGEHVSALTGRNKNNSFKQRIYRRLIEYNSIYSHPTSTNRNVLSSIGFVEFKSQLVNMGYNVLTSILQPISYKQVIGSKKLVNMLKYKNCAIRHGCFNDLYNEQFFHYIEEARVDLLKLMRRYAFKGVFLFTDEYFESKLLLEVARELSIPTFDFLHGLPGIYSLEVDSHADYLMVWGEKIKQNYLDLGFKDSKVIVVGNTKYGKYNKNVSLRSSLDNVLVIPVSSLSEHQHLWCTPVLMDRSMVVLYLYEVQNVLERLNVKHARFRPHPSISINWVYNFLDHEFWIKDEMSLNDSLRQSSLVIGAASTVLMESLMTGVNYVVFEPQTKDENMLRLKPVPPFDGSDSQIQVSRDEEELYSMLVDNYKINTSILEDYMQPLDLKRLNGLLSD